MSPTRIRKSLEQTRPANVGICRLTVHIYLYRCIKMYVYACTFVYVYSDIHTYIHTYVYVVYIYICKQIVASPNETVRGIFFGERWWHEWHGSLKVVKWLTCICNMTHIGAIYAYIFQLEHTSTFQVCFCTQPPHTHTHALALAHAHAHTHTRTHTAGFHTRAGLPELV